MGKLVIVARRERELVLHPLLQEMLALRRSSRCNKGNVCGATDAVVDGPRADVKLASAGTRAAGRFLSFLPLVLALEEVSTAASRAIKPHYTVHWINFK